eukprot:295400-Chlamydomonas_euryale.AAC.4
MDCNPRRIRATDGLSSRLGCFCGFGIGGERHRTGAVGLHDLSCVESTWSTGPLACLKPVDEPSDEFIEILASKRSILVRKCFTENRKSDGSFAGLAGWARLAGQARCAG